MVLYARLAAKEEAEASEESSEASDAEGEAERFAKLLQAYQRAPGVTRQRLYYETIEEVLGNTNKVLVDTEGTGNMIYLPLDKLTERNAYRSSLIALDAQIRARENSEDQIASAIRAKDAFGSAQLELSKTKRSTRLGTMQKLLKRFPSTTADGTFQAFKAEELVGKKADTLVDALKNMFMTQQLLEYGFNPGDY